VVKARAAGLVVPLVFLAACTQDPSTVGAAAPSTAPATFISTSTSSTTSSSTTTTAAPPTTRTVVPSRKVFEQPWAPFATVGGVVLHHTSDRVELIGYHEANHDGARVLEPLPTSAPSVDMESRERATSGRTAADIVVEPDHEIRAPVTGRVKRGGTYVLYCKYHDDFVVIEPDDHPGWEVKVLHIDGVLVRAGDQVTAGETVIAPRATRLPFESQVDEFGFPPPWPHTHVEVVDPSIKDIPGPSTC
jgi:biotin carboxyl carrier protein